MILLSSLLRRVLYPAMSSAGVFAHRLRPGEVSVLTYHGLLPEPSSGARSFIDGALVSPQQFRRQLRFLKSRYTLITPEEFRKWLQEDGSLPLRAVLLTCDDGLLNVLTEMVPILRDEGARCLFFVTGASLVDGPEYLWYEELYRMLEDAPPETMIGLRKGFVRKDSLSKKEIADSRADLIQGLSALNSEDRKAMIAELRMAWKLPPHWQPYDPADERAERRYRLLNPSELHQLVAQGMTVGAHSMSHPVLARTSSEVAEREIRECRLKLEAHLQQEIWAFAYPFGNEGSAGEREMRMTQAAGYSCAFLNHGGGRESRSSPRFGLPRAHVTGQMGIAELEAHLSGFHGRLQGRFRGALPAGTEGISSCV